VQRITGTSPKADVCLSATEVISIDVMASVDTVV
jgi:hypothetical protein